MSGGRVLWGVAGHIDRHPYPILHLFDDRLRQTGFGHLLDRDVIETLLLEQGESRVLDVPHGGLFFALSESCHRGPFPVLVHDPATGRHRGRGGVPSPYATVTFS